MRRILAVATAAALVLLALGVAGASAGDEVGDRCVADDGEAGWNLIGLNNGLNGPFPPNVVHPDGGVVVAWRSELGPGLGPVQQRLIVTEQSGEEEDRKVGESAVETLVDGVNEFPTRIPAPPYAHVGLHGPVETVFCDKLDGHLAGNIDDPFALGETRQMTVLTDVGVPVQAFVEPDADRDGYGDQTQDACSAIPAFHEACPAVGIGIGKVRVRRKAIFVPVSIRSATALSAAARVRITGGARWRGRRKPVPISNWGFISIVADSSAKIRVPLPKAVRRRLLRLPRAASLKARLNASLDNAVELGGTAAKPFTVKLRGWRKPARGH